MLPVIALVGRPNVGKSTLFNRLTRTRDALVASLEGLTRDRQYGKGAIGDFDYILVDTCGMTDTQHGHSKPAAGATEHPDKKNINKLMVEQTQLAIREADLVLLLVDAKDGRMADDEEIVELLRQSARPVILVANKIDGQNPDQARGEFFALGLGKPMLISASQGTGIGQLIDEAVRPKLTLVKDETESLDIKSGSIKIAVVGRPNVGKSTLVNSLLGEHRVVVFDEPGTTRDSIYIPYERAGSPYVIIDTAGVRRRGRVTGKVEKFSVIKTLEAIEQSHVVVLMIDAREGIVDQDLSLLSHVLDAGRALVLAVNKWDGLSRERKQEVKRELERRLTSVDFATRHFLSAKSGSRVGQLYPAIHQAYQSAMLKVKTSRLNEILEQALLHHQPPLVRGRRIKLRYAHLGGSNPPLVIIHGNQTEALSAAYRRYLAHQFIDALRLKGTPLRLEFRTSGNPFKGRKNKLTERQVKSRKRLLRHVKKKKAGHRS